jgi:hypothetical protein
MGGRWKSYARRAMGLDLGSEFFFFSILFLVSGWEQAIQKIGYFLYRENGIDYASQYQK